ncbi:PQQ-dependent dehydrogenase, methanol/ethanol family [Glacieibacterium frigidum]|uniref:PQQ-dependent dehydrogenase, methanol/ethanol family n=1 Tax=Glacieibacterium frigidum TaxID=2593303 RepID=A0A552UJ51_9SPHN|nr:PQQ-dependent dehydrogenase, methanol/ethanol family [Glacieibacterium frigidum]TRW18269.1 PQQ-dependent dehydrogenase, methanol/ethanol family [Glacieibacterium frigidum]
MGWRASTSILALAGAAWIGLGGAAPQRAAVTSERLLGAAAEPGNWLTHGGTYLEQRFSTLDQINAGNVGKLGLAWSYDLDTNRGQEATPLVIDGVMYTTTAWSKVAALDAATGKPLWTFDPKVPGERGFSACCDVVNRGLAAYRGRLYLGTLDGRLIALDAATGKVVWSVVTVDQSKPYTITGAPRIVKGRVVIGNGGAEYGVRGYVSAYDAMTGKMAWRFYTVPGDPAKGPDGAASDSILATASATWFGKYWRAGGGGTVWDAIVYDPELDQLYIGVGNGSPWNQQVRSEGKGDNLFLSSVVALDPDTGAYKWHYQGTPGETWDFTQTQPIILADLTIDGVKRKALMQAPKNGFFYVVDRTSGKLISAKNFVAQTWATGVDLKTGRPIEVEGARFQKAGTMMAPSALGAHNWHPMAYSPQTGLVYLPAQDVPYYYETATGYKYRAGAWNIAVDAYKNAPPNDRAQTKAIRSMLKGQLIAWDPVAQREVWRAQYDGPWNGGALATAGNLVFQGTGRGTFQAFDAAKGSKLWEFPAQTGVIAGPVTYTVKGVQYVAVMAGYGGAYPISSGFDEVRPAQNGRVLVFKVGGTAKLPPPPPLDLPPPNPPTETFTAVQLTHGGEVFEGNCGVCHGGGARSSGVLPDLRRSGALADPAMWQTIVHDGALKDRGMIGFGKYLTKDDIEAVRGYVGVQAKYLASEEAGAKGGR